MQNVNLTSLRRNVSLHHDGVLFELIAATPVFASHVARDATETLFCKSSESLALASDIWVRRTVETVEFGQGHVVMC